MRINERVISGPEPLKPCPFCGEAVSLVQYDAVFKAEPERIMEGLYAIDCNCFCIDGSEDLNKLVSDWNTRPNEEKLEQEITRLAELVHKADGLANEVNILTKENKELLTYITERAEAKA